MASSPGPVPLPPNIGAITSSQLIGTLLDFFLFGTLFIQVYVYRACFPKDRVAIKWLVYLVFLVMLVCTCLNAADIYYWFGAGFGDITRFSKAGFSPFYTPLMGSVIALVVQLFFCYRISVFRTGSARAVWWSVAIASISLLQAAGGMGGGILAFIKSNEQHDHARTILVYLWLVGDAVADLMIAATMTHLLKQAEEPETRDIVRGVVRLIIETNSFSASVAIVGLALYAGMPKTDYFICPTMILPGIYANTLLVLLNNRAAPSRMHNMRPDYSSGGTGTSHAHLDDGYVGSQWGTTTAGATSSVGGHGMWKTVGGGPTGVVHLQKLDYNAPGAKRIVPEEIGAFVAAPNPNFGSPEGQGLRVDGGGAKGAGFVSEWDDKSYQDGGRWDDRGTSLDLTEVEASHPYSGGYAWAR